MRRRSRHPFYDELWKLLLLAGPVAGAQLAQVSMGFIDTVMVGRLGSEALAGVALGNTTFFFVLIFCMGVVTAVGPMVSQAYGAQHRDEIGRYVRQGLWMGLGLAGPAILLLWNVAPLWRLAGQVEATVVLAQDYLRAVVWAFLPALWFVALRGFVEGIARPLPVTLIAFCGAGINVGANYVLMFGKLGLPALGLVGTGWATTIVYWCMVTLLALLVRWHRMFRAYGVFQRLGRPDPKILRELLRIGWPIGASTGIEVGLFMMTAFMIGWLGVVPLAAHQVALQCAAITFMVPLGIGIATAVRVGQAAGRRDAGGVRRAGLAGVCLAGAFMTGTALLFWTIPEHIVALFLDAETAEQVAPLAVSLLGVAAVFQLFDGVQVAAMGALRGLKDTRVPMLIAFFSYWILGLSTGYALGFVVGWGAIGLWWGLVAGLLVAAGLLLWRFFRHAAPVGTTPETADL